MSTYPRGTYEEVWEALFTMGALFRRTALYVAEQLGFEYDMGQDQRVTSFLQRCPAPPADAKAIY